MPNEKVIAFVIYPGLTPLDLVGPLQVLSTLSKFAPEYQTVVVGETLEPIKADNGMTFIPGKTFAEVPHPFAVLVPGGGPPTLRALVNPAIRRYVSEAAETAEVVASVCTGALILAGVGLLKGRPATTHWAFYKILEHLGSPYRRSRWVEADKFILSAGVSAGVDMALQLVARLTDPATARKIQLAIQYDPQPPFGRIDWSRMDLSSRLIRLFISLQAPFIANRAKRLLRQGQ